MRTSPQTLEFQLFKADTNKNDEMSKGHVTAHILRQESQTSALNQEAFQERLLLCTEV